MSRTPNKSFVRSCKGFAISHSRWKCNFSVTLTINACEAVKAWHASGLYAVMQRAQAETLFGSFTWGTSTTVCAKAWKEGLDPSEVAKGTYIVAGKVLKNSRQNALLRQPSKYLFLMQLSLGGFEEGLPLPKKVEVTCHSFGKTKVEIHEGEFWTSKQRDGHSIHEVSYRACYKPQLPEYFLKRHTVPGSVVFDPFLGRGTTLIEARLHGCRTVGSDVNPLCVRLALPRLRPPTLEQIKERLNSVVLNATEAAPSGLLEFFHQDTLQEIQGWMAYFQQRRELGLMDRVDELIEMVAANRLTGHSNGFFSVYTLPPNQAVSVERQKKINAKLKQRPEYRNTRLLILKKSRSLFRDAIPHGFSEHSPKLFQASADTIPQVASNSVDLVVTSPPFLNEVDYLQDNWMRMWFCGIELEKSSMWQIQSIPEWTGKMESVLRELRRVLKKDGVVAFEVGEVRKGTVRLELEIVGAGIRAGFKPERVLINSQKFTKTSNCWGVDNNRRGTNSNRIVVFRKQ